MKLTKESIKHNVAWKGYRLPQYDIDAVRENTHKAPTWRISAPATCSAPSRLCWRSAC